MSEPQDTPQPTVVATPAPLTPEEKAALAKARRGRNIAIALGLVAFIAIVYAVTLVRMGGYVAQGRF